MAAIEDQSTNPLPLLLLHRDPFLSVTGFTDLLSLHFRVIDSQQSPSSSSSSLSSVRAAVVFGRVSFTAENLHSLPSLELVAATSASTDHIDHRACRLHGVAVTGIGDSFSRIQEKLKLVLSVPLQVRRQPTCHSRRFGQLVSFRSKTLFRTSSAIMASTSIRNKVIDSHLHVWASPEEAADKYPYFPGNEPTLPGNVQFLLNCMKEAEVDGALIVQPINHKFDHSYVTSVLKSYPSKFVGCCLANPAEDGSGVKHLEQLVSEDGYRAVRFNPYLWPPGQKMTNKIGKALFCKAGELGIPVGFMCMKGLSLHILEIEELCTEFPSTIVLLDHFGFCKPPKNVEENQAFSELLNLSRFPQVYVKFSALFRVSRLPYPYEDISETLSQVVTKYGANRVMWGTDFPFVVPECDYKGARDAVPLITKLLHISDAELDWIMGRTVMELFPNGWCP